MKTIKKKVKKIALNSLAVIFIIGTGYGLVVAGLILSEFKAAPDDEAAVDTLLILGAQVKGSQGTAYPSRSLQERLDTAAAYWREHPDVTVIVSGGQGSDEPDAEANVMAAYLIAQGLPDSQIIREDQSTSTLENMQFSSQLHSLKRGLVVTNDYHMYRTKMLGRRLGLHLEGLSAATKNNSRYHGYLRETLALGYSLLFNWPAKIT